MNRGSLPALSIWANFYFHLQYFLSYCQKSVLLHPNLLHHHILAHLSFFCTVFLLFSFSAMEVQEEVLSVQPSQLQFPNQNSKPPDFVFLLLVLETLLLWPDSSSSLFSLLLPRISVGGDEVEHTPHRRTGSGGVVLDMACGQEILNDVSSRSLPGGI
jgi:hypothetical protein